MIRSDKPDHFLFLFEYKELGDEIVRNRREDRRDQEYHIVVPAKEFIEYTVDDLVKEEGQNSASAELEILLEHLLIIMFKYPGPVGEEGKGR